ncbi:30S ribosomal protein S6 [Candidatus Berkelbacteria bacterium]|nr:30S ribosomal protein S6 [Candidatus Berkelbacteria bacterium]
MTDYELTVITREESIADLEKLIEEAGGQIQSRQPMGRKTLAYSIKKETAGYYTSIRLNLDPAKIEALNKQFLLQANLLRHLLVVIPTHKLTSHLEVEEIKEAKEVNETDSKNVADDQERSKALDEQLSKLIGGDEPENQKEI